MAKLSETKWDSKTGEVGCDVVFGIFSTEDIGDIHGMKGLLSAQFISSIGRIIKTVYLCVSESLTRVERSTSLQVD